MISIIIPVYNAEKYLERCLESILASTCVDYEIILVDDGSTDHSRQLCRQFSRMENRIRLIKQRHRGVSEARNRGIEASRGEWIVFVDADDMISADFLQMIVQVKYHDQDLLLFDYVKFRGKGKREAALSFENLETVCCFFRENRVFLIEKLLSAEQILEKGNTSLLSPWGKAYKKSVIERYSIRFPSDVIIGEDRIFNIEYLLKTEACMYISRTVYYTRVHSDSAMRRFHLDYLQNDYIYQKKLKSILVQKAIFPFVKRAYYNSVLTSMADVLIRGIFNPFSSRHYCENINLCEAMQQYEIYRKALEYNGKSGNLPRRILLFSFQKRYYHVLKWISRLSYIVLAKLNEL